MLSDDQAEGFHRRIMERIAEIDEQLVSSAESSEAVALDLPIGRLTRNDALQQQQVALHLRRRLETEKIRLVSALARIHAGQFGTCPSCRRPIPKARLEAMPGAPLCASCEAKRSSR